MGTVTYAIVQFPPDKHCEAKLYPESLRVRIQRLTEISQYFTDVWLIGPQVRTGWGSCTAYTNAVDIWSLGVAILRFAYGLPHPGSYIGWMFDSNHISQSYPAEEDYADFFLVV